jgi:hypothetical protein
VAVDEVKVVDAGERIMISGPNRDGVEAAVNALVAKGVRVMAPAAQLGSRWVATCEKLPDGTVPEIPTLTDDQSDADDTLLRKVRVTDAGDHLMITSPDKSAVEAAVAALAREGGRVLATPAPLGNGWIATFEKPAVAENRCTIERAGFQFIVRGSTRGAVETKLADLAERGAKPIGDVEHVGGEWVGVCDAGDMTGIMRVR